MRNAILFTITIFAGCLDQQGTVQQPSDQELTAVDESNVAAPGASNVHMTPTGGEQLSFTQADIALARDLGIDLATVPPTAQTCRSSDDCNSDEQACIGHRCIALPSAR
ncbi:MAG: hypothetical protein QM831_04710 [Kofleriaceae bacterium]